MSDENITVVGASPLAASYPQYLRTIRLTVGVSSSQAIKNAAAANKNGKPARSVETAIDLSELRVQFSIVAASASTPRQLNCRVFNLSRGTASKIEREFDTISLSAGYQGHNGLLFQGSMQQKRYGRESPTDTYFDLFAADGYDVLANGFISQTFAAGWTFADVYREIIAAAAPNLKTSSQPVPATPVHPRPLVMFGPLRKVMEGLSRNLGLKWHIDSGILYFIPPSVVDPMRTAAFAPNKRTAVVLSPSTGLIGIPSQTLDGIEATCLLNSGIKPGDLVEIDRSLITAGKNDLSVGAVNPYPSIAYDGIYRVMWVEHEGDTRGNPWYTHIVAESAGPNDATTIQQGAIEKAGFAGGY